MDPLTCCVAKVHVCKVIPVLALCRPLASGLTPGLSPDSVAQSWRPVILSIKNTALSSLFTFALFLYLDSCQLGLF